MNATQKSSKRLSTHGFTLIEVLMVIGILVVLVGIAFVAMHGTTQAAKTLSTRQTLGNLAGMFAELDTATNGSPRQPGVWLWTADGKTVLRVPTAAVAGWTFDDFWHGPRNNTTNPVSFDPVASPGLVSEAGPRAQRHAAIAIINTSLAMSLIAGNPANRSRIQAIPLPQQFTLEWVEVGPNPKIKLPGADHFMGYWPTNNESVDDPTAAVQYVAGVHVRWTESSTTSDHLPHFYVADTGFVGNGTPNPASKVAGQWNDETTAPYHVPLLRDAWDNPIIFVPASGMCARRLSGKKNLDPADATQCWIVVSPEGTVMNNGTAGAMVTTPGRPFFASAGPDGDFTTDDDNLYSFEK